MVDGDGLDLFSGDEAGELAASFVFGVFPCGRDALPEVADGFDLTCSLSFPVDVLLDSAALRIREEILER